MKRSIVIISFLLVMLFYPAREVSADHYTSATEFYDTYGADKIEWRQDGAKKDSGFYFVSRAKKGSSGTRLTTVGFKMMVEVDSKEYTIYTTCRNEGATGITSGSAAADIKIVRTQNRTENGVTYEYTLFKLKYTDMLSLYATRYASDIRKIRCLFDVNSKLKFYFDPIIVVYNDSSEKGTVKNNGNGTVSVTGTVYGCYRDSIGRQNAINKLLEAASWSSGTAYSIGNTMFRKYCDGSPDYILDTDRITLTHNDTNANYCYRVGDNEYWVKGGRSFGLQYSTTSAFAIGNQLQPNENSYLIYIGKDFSDCTPDNFDVNLMTGAANGSTDSLEHAATNAQEKALKGIGLSYDSATVTRSNGNKVFKTKIPVKFSTSAKTGTSIRVYPQGHMFYETPIQDDALLKKTADSYLTSSPPMVTGEAGQSIKLQVDNTAPKITIETEKTANDGWINTAQELNVTATDGDKGSGIDTIVLKDVTTVYDTIDAGSMEMSKTSNLVIRKEGNITYQIVATDNVKNTSTHSVTVKIDYTPPVIQGTTSGIQGDTTEYGWYPKNKQLTFTVTDALSGIKSFCIMNDAGTTVLQNGTVNGTSASVSMKFTTDGTSYYRLKAVDNAGNVTEKRISVKIDGTPPEIEDLYHVLSEYDAVYYDKETEWLNTGILSGDCGLYAYASDSATYNSGLKRFVIMNPEKTETYFNGRIYQYGQNAEILLEFDEEGIFDILCIAEDNAGNVTERTFTVKVDNTAPQITLTDMTDINRYNAMPLTSDITMDWINYGYRQTVFMTEDSLSGISGFVLSKNNVTLTSTYAVTGNNQYKLGYRMGDSDGIHDYIISAEDKAGNVTSRTITVKRDTKPPAVNSLRHYYDENGKREEAVYETECGWFLEETKLQGSAEDVYGGSGLKRFVIMNPEKTKTYMQGSIEYGRWGSANMTFTQEGIHDYVYIAEDNAGNITERTFTVKVDTENPQIVMTDALDAAYKNVKLGNATLFLPWRNKERRITFTVTDSGSGISSSRIIRNGITETSVSGNGAASCTLSHSFCMEGSIAYIIKASDQAGHITTAVLVVRIDTVPPEIILPHLETEYLDNAELSFEAVDYGSQMNKLTLYRPDGTALKETTENNSSKYNTYAGYYRDLTYNFTKTKTYTLKAVDNAGNSTTKEFDITITPVAIPDPDATDFGLTAHLERPNSDTVKREEHDRLYLWQEPGEAVIAKDVEVVADTWGYVDKVTYTFDDDFNALFDTPCDYEQVIAAPAERLIDLYTFTCPANAVLDKKYAVTVTAWKGNRYKSVRLCFGIANLKYDYYRYIIFQ